MSHQELKSLHDGTKDWEALQPETPTSRNRSLAQQQSPPHERLTRQQRTSCTLSSKTTQQKYPTDERKTDYCQNAFKSLKNGSLKIVPTDAEIAGVREERQEKTDAEVHVGLLHVPRSHTWTR